MTETNVDTAPDGAEAPAADDAAAAAVTPDELATLKSRNSGLNAKVTELTNQLKAEKQARTAAEQAAIDKAGADEPLKQRIAALEAELEAGKKAAALATKGAQYPEAYRELGDDIAGMSTEKLAALEARLTSAKDDSEEPETAKPVGNNPQRGDRTGAKNIEDMTSAELQAAIKNLPREAFGLEPR